MTENFQSWYSMKISRTFLLDFPAHPQTHVVEGDKVFRQLFISLLLQPSHHPELVPDVSALVAVKLNTVRRYDAVEVCLLTARPPAGNVSSCDMFVMQSLSV